MTLDLSSLVLAIASLGQWFDYARKRSITSHTYYKNISTEVYDVAKPFLFDAKDLLAYLEKMKIAQPFITSKYIVLL